MDCTKKNDLIELQITNVAYGGKGIARMQEKVIFVKDAIQGDVVRCEITNDKGNFAEAEVRSVVTKSPLRVDSQCKYSQTCGGCQWQDVAYNHQLAWKKSFIVDAINRIAKLSIDENFVMIPSPDQYFYRNRVTLRGTIQKSKKVGIGFFKEETREQIHIDQCIISHPHINELIQFINSMQTTAKPQKFRIEVQQIPYLHSGKDLFVTLFPMEKPYKLIDDFLRQIRSHTRVFWADTSDKVKSGPKIVFEEDRIKYFSSPGQFQQINTKSNQILREIIFDYVEQKQPKIIFDLFCGSGNLSLNLTNSARKVFGAELNEASIQVAKTNVKENNLSQAQYQCGDALKIFAELVKEKIFADLLIVDPPRRGMKEVVPAIINLKPEYIVYVSCDPMTMARDVKMLAEKYVLEKIIGLDFFPNTYHVETVAFLRKA